MRSSIMQTATIALLAALCLPASAGEVYRWQDAGGRVHFGDRPAEGSIRQPIRGDYAPAARAQWRRVVRVYDGDTLTLENGEKVRLLGINAPEVGGFKPLEAGGLAARDWLRGQILERAVRLEPDAEARDAYGRSLRHVFAAGGLHLNLALVELGLATTDIHPPNLKYADALIAAERRAEREGRGLWAMPEYRPRPVEALAGNRPEGWVRLAGAPVAIIRGKAWQALRFVGGFEARIPKESLKFFPPLESFVGRTLEMRGWLARRGGGNSLFIHHPAALLIR
jgi:micrococcal nuclease